MKKPFRICILSIILPFALGIAQASEIDSLKAILRTAVDDTNKVNILLSLCNSYFMTSPEEATKYANQAIELAEKLDFQKGKAYALKGIGMCYYFRGEYLETVNYWKLSLNTFDSIGDKVGTANMLNNLGAIYFNQGDDVKAIDYYLKSLRVSEEIGNKLRIATALINIGGVYFNKHVTHDKALSYYVKALPLSMELDDQDAIGTCAVNMGEIYFVRKDLDSALLFFNMSLEAFRKSDITTTPYSLNGIGRVYSAKGDYLQAVRYQKEALKIASDHNLKLDIAQSYLSLGNTYEQQGDIKSALESFDHAQSTAREIGANYELKSAYEALAGLYAKKKDFTNAYKYETLLTGLKDTLYNAENDKKIQSLQFNFDLEKKEDEIKLLTKDKELKELDVKKQKVIKNAFLAGLIFILIIAFILYRNNIIKKRTNIILDKKNAEIESLILNILPREVAAELQANGNATPRYYESVSVLFTDFKGFSSLAKRLTPNELVDELSDFFIAFDNIIENHNLEKIKTIGDAYMCAGGIPTSNETHPISTVKAGLAMQDYMRITNEKRKENGKIPWDLRVGIHTGPVVAGVVGKKKYAYDIWGSSVNISSRMESNGEVGKVNISETTYKLVKDQFKCHHRGKIYAKNVGEIDMYFVENEIKTSSS